MLLNDTTALLYINAFQPFLYYETLEKILRISPNPHMKHYRRTKREYLKLAKPYKFFKQFRFRNAVVDNIQQVVSQ